MYSTFSTYNSLSSNIGGNKKPTDSPIIYSFSNTTSNGFTINFFQTTGEKIVYKPVSSIAVTNLGNTTITISFTQT
jgi:hypothetical protein